MYISGPQNCMVEVCTLQICMCPERSDFYDPHLYGPDMFVPDMNSLGLYGPDL
jgi:hypothetical protein